MSNIRNKISASLMCSDLYNMNEDIKLLEQEKIDYLHIDIMDGHFVKNLGLGIDFIKQLRKYTNIPFDYHLMVENPNKIIPMLGIEENDIISVHFESTYHIQETIDIIKQYKCKLFLAMNPATPILILDTIHPYIDGINFMTVQPGLSGQQIVKSSFNKFKRLIKYLEDIQRDNVILEVDGNMSFENAKLFNNLGANIFVAGTSSIFPNHKLDKKALEKYKEIIQKEIIRV